jgi:hypothetical protein
MRVILALAGAAVALSLSGCDINTNGQKQANCNCVPAPVAPPVATTGTPDLRGSTAYRPPEEPRPVHHRHRERGYAYDGGGGHHGYYYWRREYSEVSVAMYDYHSGSTSSYFGFTGGGVYHGGGDYHGGHGEHDGHGGGYHGTDHGWIDGYGRGHGGYTGDAVHYESRADDGRDHPWHGYDADCPGDPHRGHR